MIVFIGVFGLGKLIVGLLLVQCFGEEFVDVDVVIEQVEGCDILEIFFIDGELYFCKVER